MTELSARIRLRPTRIALLVRPTDLTSVRTFMRLCTALWGGAYNPIIPVFRTPPREWRTRSPARIKGLAIARGYVEFFEPDAYVEAEEGLLQEAGLGAFRQRHALRENVFALKDFLKPRDHRDWSETSAGLGIIDALRSIYETEQRFQLRDRRPATLVKPDRGSALVEALFGIYPQDKPSRYIEQGYKDVYNPNVMAASPDAWREMILKGATVPLRVTGHTLKPDRSWHHNLKVVVFDPSKVADLIDLWNMRLEPPPVVGVPLDWVEPLAKDVRDLIRHEHSPVQGNPHGLMHHATVEFTGSVSEARRDAVQKLLSEGLPERAVVFKNWRNRIWEPHTDDRVLRDTRLQVWANEKSASLVLSEYESGRQSASCEALSPDFANQYGAGDLRWINSVSVTYSHMLDVARVLPFNTFDPSWPRLDYNGAPVIVGCEGWVFGQQYKEHSSRILFPRAEEAVIGSLKRLGIEAQPSDAGRLAKQVLTSLEGLWGAFLLADRDTLELINKMAGGVRRRGAGDEEIEEVFDRRVRPLKDWMEHLARRKARKRLPEVTLEDFTKRRILQLGVETDCPHCKATNWHSLSAVDYSIVCERCLKTYGFPEAELRPQNRNWSYRVVGPFSVPDYARGAYGALLALRALDKIGFGHDAMTFATALDLAFDGEKTEADYVAWKGAEKFGVTRRPQLVIGEAKSFGKGDLLKPKDLAKLRKIAAKLPGAVIAISVLRDSFTANEKKLLTPFVRWCRRTLPDGEPANPVILMTANELFYDITIAATWKDLGGRHAAHRNFDYTRDLRSFADATQAIYLGLLSFEVERMEAWKKRAAARKAKTAAVRQRTAG